MTTLTVEGLRVGGRYNWKYQEERLTYMGSKMYHGDPRGWYQFALVEEPGEVWCEVTAADLHMLEETQDVGQRS